MYSQFGEDKYIVENLKYPKENGFFIDVGAYKPKLLSNTYYFESVLNWDGLCIEPDPSLIPALKEERKRVLQYAVADYIGKAQMYRGEIPDWNSLIKQPNSTDILFEVNVTTLDKIIEQERVTKIDILSIDVEGAELCVLKGLTKLKPSIIIVEFSHNNIDDLVRYLVDDYALVHITQANFIYIKRENTAQDK